MKTVTSIAILLILSMGLSSADETSPAKNKDIPTRKMTSEEVVGRILDEYIVQEFNAKNITLAEACATLNRQVKAHLTESKSEFMFSGITYDKNTSIKDEKLFIHVKGLSLRWVIMIINAQTHTQFKIKGNTLIIFPPVIE